MKLKCIKSVQMKGKKKKDRFQAFTEGKEYRSRKGTAKGIDGDPYSIIPVLRAKNDKGESHIIKILDGKDLNEFFNSHFKVIQ